MTATARKLTVQQTRHLANIQETNDSFNQDAYMECGKSKPYSRPTMDSLIRHGLVTGTLVRRHNLFTDVHITTTGRTALDI